MWHIHSLFKCYSFHQVMLVELSLHNIFNVMKSILYLHTKLQLDLLSYTFIHTTEL